MSPELPESSQRFKSTKETRSRYREMVKREFPPLEPEELDPEVFHFSPNYHLRKGVERNNWEGEDIGERLTHDPSYIDRI